MARVALVKIFTGLNLGVSQLSGELRRAGHDSLVIFFKDYVVAPNDEASKYEQGEHQGYWVGPRGKLLNCNLYKPFTEREYELLIETLAAFRPDLIGFSMHSKSMLETEQVTARLKCHFNNVPIIWGGSGPTLQPERAIETADLVCVGEGEELIVDLANRVDSGAPLTADIPGLWWKKPGGEVVKGIKRSIIDLDKLAFPDFDESHCVYINENRSWLNVYPHNMGRQHHIMTQRGCPYSCSFCIESWYQDQWGKKNSLRRRSVDLVIDELVAAKRKRNIEAVMFYDDVFTVNPRWLREFASKYKRAVGLPFWCYSYPRTTRKEDLLMLKDAGLVSMTIGIQSGSKPVLEAYNRPVDREITIRASRWIAESGIIGFFDLMTRSEVETDATCRETFEFLLELPREMKTVGFFPMQLYPNYAYTEAIQKEGKKITLSDAEYEFWHKLYFLSRTSLPTWVKRAVSNRRIFRRFPNLIDPLIPAQLPFFYLDYGAIDLQNSRFELTDAKGEKLRSFLTAGDTHPNGAPSSGMPAGAATAEVGLARAACER